MDQSVAEYAQEAGISERRVRMLAEAGQIAATKYGNTWVISEPSPLYAKHRQGSGRPLNEDGAWDLALRLDGYMPISARPSRTEQRITKLKLLCNREENERLESTLMRWLSARATTLPLFGSKSEIDEIRRDPRLHATGVSHPDSGLLQADELDAYVTANDRDAVLDDYLLVETTKARANVILRVTDLPEVPRVIPRLMVAIDLLERGTAREVSAAQEILEDVL